MGKIVEIDHEDAADLIGALSIVVDMAKKDGHRATQRHYAGLRERLVSQIDKSRAVSQIDETRAVTASCGRPWVAEIELCPRCGLNAGQHTES